MQVGQWLSGLVDDVSESRDRGQGFALVDILAKAWSEEGPPHLPQRFHGGLE
jgi:hypothetical protein